MFIDDKTRLLHMVEAAEEAISFVQGLSFEDMRRDRKLGLALVKCLEVVGEAAFKVSKDYRDGHPDIPWTELIKLRNRLIHEYHDISCDQVWETIQQDLPGVLPPLRKLVTEMSN